MADLGLLGALGGLGKGMIDDSKRRLDQQDLQAKSAMDEARESRLAAIAAGYQKEADERNNNAAQTRTETSANASIVSTGISAGTSAANTTARITNDNEQAGLDRVSEQTEARLDRESRERIAGMKDEDVNESWKYRQGTHPITGERTDLLQNDNGDVLVVKGKSLILAGVDPEKDPMFADFEKKPELQRALVREFRNILKENKDNPDAQRQLTKEFLYRYKFIPTSAKTHLLGKKTANKSGNKPAGGDKPRNTGSTGTSEPVAKAKSESKPEKQNNDKRITALNTKVRRLRARMQKHDYLTPGQKQKDKVRLSELLAERRQLRA